MAPRVSFLLGASRTPLCCFFDSKAPETKGFILQVQAVPLQPPLPLFTYPLLAALFMILGLGLMSTFFV